MNTFKYRGTLVTITLDNRVNKLTPYTYSAIQNNIELLNKIGKLARKEPSITSYIRSEVRNKIVALRQEMNPSESSVGVLRIERIKSNQRKAKKLSALLSRFNKRTYNNYSISSKEVNIRVYDSSIANIKTISGQVNGFNQKIKEVREFSRSQKVINRNFFSKATNSYISYTLENGVFAPGQLSHLSKEIKSREIFNAKKPRTMERHVAVEIECFGPISRTDLGIELANAGLGKYIELKSDGSISPGEGRSHAYELAVLAPASVFGEVITKTCEILSQEDCRVNKSCGLHVHLDTRGLNAGRMFSNLVSAQSMLYKMQPISRRDNRFCEPTPSKNLDVEIRKGKRYLGINPMSYRRHNTIEVRLHSGTVDAKKILNFVRLLELIAYNVKEVKRAASTLKGFVKQNNIPPALEAYITERISKFATPGLEEAV